MPSTDRRGRERAERHQLIITAARELAEAEGWDAVTTRRLAERVEYSQPVLYGHFDGKDAIVRAVALEGFAELAAQLGRAQPDGPSLHGVCTAYLDFADRRPALYQAMFVLPTDLKFASDETPEPLRAAFGELVTALIGQTSFPELLAELLWSALHGLAVLTQSGRIPAAGQAQRVDALVERMSHHARARTTTGRQSR
ncbi:TetR/AcrR family transcriptional regulator [Kitasatospora sp. McL0602]|uniref:TetR/AcrR family transcriptional regulator n=1 Tax=Kitasatospora sp. McL0602 TaxID=3439530 RepID=UPI003F8ADCD6